MTISFKKRLLGAFSSSHRFATGLTLAAIFSLTATTARADYFDAKIHFESLQPKDQFFSVMGLATSGDFNSFTAFGYTEDLYKDILAYEKRHGLQVDGKLQDWEVAKLQSDLDSLAQSVGFATYTHERVGSVLWIPSNLFETDTAIENGVSFQRKDKAYSLSFVAHPNEKSSFEQLFEVLRTPSENRTIDYNKKRDSFFVVTGANKGRNFYTYMAKIPSGATGFTLTYKVENSEFANKLAVIMANAFVPVRLPEEPLVAEKEHDEPVEENEVASSDKVIIKPKKDEVVISGQLDANTDSIKATAKSVAISPDEQIAKSPLVLEKEKAPLADHVAESSAVVDVQVIKEKITVAKPIQTAVVVHQSDGEAASIFSANSQQADLGGVAVGAAVVVQDSKGSALDAFLDEISQGKRSELIEETQVNEKSLSDSARASAKRLPVKIEQVLQVSNSSSVAESVQNSEVEVNSAQAASGVASAILAFFGFWIIALVLIYWLPTVVAISRKHRNLTAIIILNLFIGWTFVGWIVLLIWAFSNPPQPRVVAYVDASRLAGMQSAE